MPKIKIFGSLNHGDIRFISQMILSLLIFSMVFSIQLFSGFQPDNTALAIIIIATINCILIGISIKNIYRKEIIFKNLKFNPKGIYILSLVLLLSFSFLSYGIYMYFISEEVYFDYPTNGVPIERKISFFGHYKNINDYTLIWLYTSSNKFYFEESAVSKIDPLWTNRGKWTLTKSVVGSDNPNENGLNFIFSSVKVPAVAERAMQIYITMYNTSSNGTTEIPQWVHKNNENVYTYRSY